MHPEQAEKKFWSQGLPVGAEVTAGAPRRTLPARGWRYCFHNVTASLGVKFDCPELSGLFFKKIFNKNKMKNERRRYTH